jgi:hypothetical protein
MSKECFDGFRGRGTVASHTDRGEEDVSVCRYIYIYIRVFERCIALGPESSHDVMMGELLII